MPTEKWVNAATGSNANPGTEGSPYQTLYYAVDANRTPPDGQLIVNVVGALTETGSSALIRLVPQHLTTSILVRSATPGVPFTVPAASTVFIRVFANPVCSLRIEDADITCERIIGTDGSNLGTRNFTIELAGSCSFTHGRNNAEAAMFLPTPASGGNTGTIRFLPGVEMTGWQTLCSFEQGAAGAAIGTLDIDGLILTSGSDANAGVTVMAGNIIRIRNSTLSFTNGTVGNRLYFRGYNASELTFENNVYTNAGNTGQGIYFEAPSAASANAACSVNFNDNTLTFSGGCFAQVGTDINTGLTRAANDANVMQFVDCNILRNSMVQTSLGGSLLSVYLGANGAIVRDNYFRVAAINTSTNVHQVYLHAADVTFKDNMLACSLLAFSDRSVISGNVIVAKRSILLGGTQGGSLAIKGGNNYTIVNNILIATEDDCIGDYAWLGAYPTNIGVLQANVNNNKYVVLTGLGADGIARLTNGNASNGWTATTLAQLQNVWQQSVLSGTGTGVWGVASNAGNDSFSKLVDGQDLDFLKDLCTSGNTLSLGSLKAIKKQFTASGSGGGGIIRPIVR